jgi:superfamily II DNA or RNA helicase
MFILDEAQYAGSSTFQLINRMSIGARHRFLFSGTPWRDSGDDILLEASCGPKICDVDAKFLIDKGFLVKPHIFYKEVKKIAKPGTTYQEVYKRYIVENVDRNNLILKATKILLKDNRNILILFKQIKHGKMIAELLEDNNISTILLNGSMSSSDRQSIIKEVKSGKHRVILASTIFDQGVDIPILDALILAGGGASSGRLLQRVGRVIRTFENKSDAIVYDFLDNCKYLKNHSEKRFKILMSEPGFEVHKI